jgi:hypothetical protein
MAERVILHASSIKKDVVADGKQILENLESEARGVAVDAEGLASVLEKAFFKRDIEREGPEDFGNGVLAVDVHFGSEQFPVQVGSVKEAVVAEKDRFHPFQRGVKRWRADNPAGTVTGLDLAKVKASRAVKTTMKSSIRPSRMARMC